MNTFTPLKPPKGNTEKWTLQISDADLSAVGRKQSVMVTDIPTGQVYHIFTKDGESSANKVPYRPRKYIGPPLTPGKHPTGDTIRSFADDYPDEMRADMLVLADLLDERGWIECAGVLFVTEAKLREIEAEAARMLADHDDDVPGFYAEWERTVGVYEYADGEPEFKPVITMFAEKPAESHQAAAERFVAVAQEHGLSSYGLLEAQS